MDAAPAPIPEEPLTIYSVGHSNQSQAQFIALLQRHHIQSLVDVRSAPYSRYVPHFNRPELEEAVERQGIRYLYLGEELGGRPPTDDFYDAEDHVLYSRVAVAPFFRGGLERLKDEAAEYRAAIMCSEEDPTNCHRHLLIARVLDQQGVRVLHIRGDDREQTEDDLRPQPSLWDGALSPAEEEAQWKSIRSVSRRNQPRNSSRPSDEWESSDF
ncbi:MAG TPA: DUF488 domain-containing protein [Ktedonobacterales bacterium]|nr:DUF488 domain-containing protein [Ktedonobacterales bacterium]